MDDTKDEVKGEHISPKRNEKTKDETYPSVFYGCNTARDLKKLRGKNRRFQAGKQEG